MAKTLQEIFNPHATAATQPTATKTKKSLGEIFGSSAPATPTTPMTMPAAPVAQPIPPENAPVAPSVDQNTQIPAPTAKRSLGEIFNPHATAVNEPTAGNPGKKSLDEIFGQKAPAPAEGGVSGFLKDVVRSTGIPKFGVAAYNVGKSVLDLATGNNDQAATDLSAERDLPWLGKTAPALTGNETTGEGVKKILGTGLEIGSTIAGGGATKHVAQAGFKGLLKQGLKTTAKEGAAAAFAQGTGSALNENKGYAEALGTGALYAPLGFAAGALVPAVGAGARAVAKPVMKLLSPVEKKAEMAITEGVEKGIKPYFSSTAKPGVREAYMTKAADAVHTINEYRPTITGEDGIATVRNPENRRELLDAIGQAKEKLFDEYDTIARQAGDAGAQFDAAPAVNRLQAISADISYNPQIREYAAKMMNDIGELHGASPKIVQERIKDLNQQLQGFFLGRVDKMKAQVDASVAALLREQLDNQIESVGGAGYQMLKNKYGALKTIEKDVTRQVAVEARKNVKGLADFTDIFTGGDLIGGLATMNPAMFARGLAGKGIKEYIKFLNDPNRYIKNMFKAVEKVPVKKAVSGLTRPPIAGLLDAPPIVPPYTPPVKPPIQTSFTQDEIKMANPKLFAADQKLLGPPDKIYVPPKINPEYGNMRMQPDGVYEQNAKGEMQRVYDKSFNEPPTPKQYAQAAGSYKPPAAYFGTKAQREAAGKVPYPANVVEGKVIQPPVRYKTSKEFVEAVGNRPYQSGTGDNFGWYYKKDGVITRVPDYVSKILDKEKFKNLPSSKVTKTSNNLYHTTPIENLESIKNNGLTSGNKPRFQGVSGKDNISFSANEAGAKYYGGKNDVMIRTKTSFKPKDLENDLLAGADGVYVTKTNVPPEALEIKKGSKWVPLVDTVKGPPKKGISAASPLKPDQAYGVVAGVEPTRDDNGNITGVHFSPEHAAIGLGITTGGKALLGKYPELNFFAKQAEKYATPEAFQKTLGVDEKIIKNIQLFGSSVEGKVKPNDVDIFVTVKDGAMKFKKSGGLPVPIKKDVGKLSYIIMPESDAEDLLQSMLYTGRKDSSRGYSGKTIGIKSLKDFHKAVVSKK